MKTSAFLKSIAIIALLLVNVQLYAQNPVDIIVEWTDNCIPPVSSSDKYNVTLDIIDVSIPQIVGGCYHYLLSSNMTEIPCDGVFECNPDSQTKKYRVFVRVERIDTSGGQERLVCYGERLQGLYNCYDLINLGTISVILPN
jgi:hypothetical protein